MKQEVARVWFAVAALGLAGCAMLEMPDMEEMRAWLGRYGVLGMIRDE